MNKPLAYSADLPPTQPLEPEAGACCQSGCDPCVYDLYWNAVDRYEQALAEWNLRQQAACRQSTPPDSVDQP